MNREDIFQAITDLDDELIARAAPPPEQKKPRHWKRWAALAACLAVVIAAAGFVGNRLFTANGGVGAGAGGVDPPEDGGPSTFMSYAGPVFPLTLRVENSAITAERAVTLDFSPWVRSWWSNQDEADSRLWLTDDERQDVLDRYNEWYPEGGHWVSSDDVVVTDTYTLTNVSAQDQTVTVLYPFAGSLNYLESRRPVLTVEGETVEAKVYAGAYVGGYMGALGGDLVTPVSEGSLNLDSPDCWLDYRDALDSGSYLESALGAYPDLTDVSVVVYEFSDAWSEPRDSKSGVPNPTLRAWFDLDYSKTTVLSTGFHGGSFDRENGRMGKLFSIAQPGDVDYGECNRLIVVGDDIQNLSTQGYATGGWDTKKTIDAGCTVTRYETDLETALRQAAREMFSYRDQTEGIVGVDFEMYFGLFKLWLVTDGPLSQYVAERYDDGMLEDGDVFYQDRVFYLEAGVTVPAGESVTLAATMRKSASYDFYCAHTENQGVKGYDLTTKLGSNLNCTSQTATIEDRGQIEIVRQNFGFDIENGVKTVPLTEEEYYLEVKALPAEERETAP